MIWTDKMEYMLSEIGLVQNHLNKDPQTHIESFKRLQDIYHQTVFEKIKKDDSKLRTYSKFKTSPGFESYLDKILCVNERIALTKLRLSNHQLMIEKGRHLDLHRNDRIRPFCPNIIENEKHFLITCGIYKHLRTHLYTEAKNVYPFICNQPYDVRFIQLMSDSLTVPVSRFVFCAMELREFLSKKPRGCE